MKKQKIYLVLLFTFFVQSIFPQIIWEEINVPPDKRFSSITAADNGDFYIGALSTDGIGGVYRSSNEGMSWEFLGLENHGVYALSFNHEGNLLAGVGTGIYSLYLDGQRSDTKKMVLQY